METTTKGPMAAIIIIVAILIIGGALFYVNRLPRTLTYDDIVWEFQTEGAPGPTLTQLTLRIGGEEYDAGTYGGECAPIEPPQLLEDEVSGVVCMFAGVDEIGVFREDGRYVVKHGEIERPSENDPGSRGDFTTLFAL